MAVYKSVLELVGETPLVELVNYQKKHALKARILAKLESFNPGGSVKDRAAKAMIEAAEQSGKLKAESTIVEPTSGNTGIGLAMVAAVKGYKLIVTMPKTMSAERIKLLRAYGAEVVLTDGGMTGAVEQAKEIASRIKDAYIPFQFENSANPQIHYQTTAPEIWKAVDGKMDYFVAGVGSGGTITGAGEYFKSKNSKIKVIAVEPQSSPVLSGGQAGAHKIQGIGAGFIPKALNTEIYDKVITVADQSALDCCRELCKTEGILAGISSGAALSAASQIAALEENTGKIIVTVFPDTGERYLSTSVFEEI